MMTAGIAAVNDRRNTAPEFPIHECPQCTASFPNPRFFAEFEFEFLIEHGSSHERKKIDAINEIFPQYQSH